LSPRYLGALSLILSLDEASCGFLSRDPPSTFLSKQTQAHCFDEHTPGMFDNPTYSESQVLEDIAPGPQVSQ